MSRIERDLEGIPSDGAPPPPLARESTAARVAALLKLNGALGLWRKMVRNALDEHEERGRVLDAWNKRLEEHFRAAWQRQLAGQEEPKQFPGEGWTWGYMRIYMASGEGPESRPLVAAWVPPELSADLEPRTGVPLPLRWVLSLAESYAVAAAVYDATLKGVEQINPWEASAETVPGFYECMLDEAKKLTQSDATSLDVILMRVEDHLRGHTGHKPGDAQTSKGSGGRRRLAETTLKFQIYDRIRREHVAGIARRDIPERLRSDKDLMEQVKAAKLTVNKKLVKNALAYFNRPRKTQQTPPS